MPSIKINLILDDARTFEQQVKASVNRAIYGAGRNLGPQTGGLAAGNDPLRQLLLGGGGGAQPPQQSNLGREVNRSMLGIGLAAGMFSPWIGARLINQSGIFSKLFSGAGGAGGIAGTIFGGGGAGGFGASFIGLSLSVKMLKTSFEELHRAVQTTAKLYQESMAINRSTGSIAQAQAGFAAIGLGPDAAKRFAISGPGGLNPEEMMQFTNMSKEFARAYADAADDSRIIANSAEQAQKSFEAGSRLTREWHTFWTGPMTMAVGKFFKNLGADIFHAINVMRGDTSGPRGPQPMTGAFNWGTLRQTNLERMGFSLGGNAAINYLRQIAMNTGILANANGGNSLLTFAPTGRNLP